MAYLNELLPEAVSYGVEKDVLINASSDQNLGGFVQTNINWSKPLDEWRFEFGIRSRDDALAVQKLFQNALGGHTFRFKDWFDFEVTGGSLVALGGGTYQLYRTVIFGGQAIALKVTKPKTGTVTINSGTLTNVDLATGIITATGTPTSWAGEIYKHVRFLNKKLTSKMIDYEIYSTVNIELQEVRE